MHEELSLAVNEEPIRHTIALFITIPVVHESNTLVGIIGEPPPELPVVGDEEV